MSLFFGLLYHVKSFVKSFYHVYDTMNSYQIKKERHNRTRNYVID